MSTPMTSMDAQPASRVSRAFLGHFQFATAALSRAPNTRVSALTWLTWRSAIRKRVRYGQVGAFPETGKNTLAAMTGAAIVDVLFFQDVPGVRVRSMQNGADTNLPDVSVMDSPPRLSGCVATLASHCRRYRSTRTRNFRLPAIRPRHQRWRRRP